MIEFMQSLRKLISPMVIGGMMLFFLVTAFDMSLWVLIWFLKRWE